MALGKGQKIVVYLVGVILGLLILGLFPRTEPAEPHPWHAQTAPEGYYPLEFRDDYGRRVVLDQQPRWLVSLAPSITEMLFAMEMGDHLMAVSEWDAYPEAAREMRDAGRHVGRIDQPDIEAIASLRPDLVIASNLTPAGALQRIEEVSGATAVSLHHDSFDDVVSDIGRLGRLLGVPGRALASTRAIGQRRDAVLGAVEPFTDRPRRRAVMLLHLEDGLLPGWSPGKDTWLGDLIEMAHGENVAAALGPSWGQMSLESLVTADPEVIFVKDGATPGARERLRARAEALHTHPVWSQISAVRDGRVHLVDNGPFAIPGPRIVDALEIVARHLWPEAHLPTE